MKAIILAAGEAKRLRPITDQTPKCMLQVGEKTIIDYQIDNLRNVNVTDVVVVTGFMAEKLESHLLDTHPDINWIFIRNADYPTTYPAYSLWLAKEFLNGPVLYLNADVICHPAIIKNIVESPHDSITAIREGAWEEEQVSVRVEVGSMKIVELGKHIANSSHNAEFIGVTKIGTQFGEELIRVLDLFVEREEFKKFAADSLNLAIQRGEGIYAYNVSNLPAIEIDTPEDLAEAGHKVDAISALQKNGV